MMYPNFSCSGVNASVSYLWCRVLSGLFGDVEVLASLLLELYATEPCVGLFAVGFGRGQGCKETLRAGLGSPSNSGLAAGEWDNCRVWTAVVVVDLVGVGRGMMRARIESAGS